MKNEEELYQIHSNKYKKVSKLYKEMVIQLMNVDIKDINFDSNTIIIEIFNNCFISIIDMQSYRPGLFLNNGNLFLYDPNFENTKLFLQNKICNNYWLNKTLIFLSSKVQNKEENYYLIADYKIKKEYSSKYNLKIHPDKEIFLYNDDEMQFRYHKNKKMEIPKEGLLVKIIEKNAFLYENSHYRFIDSQTPNEGFKINNKVIFHKDFVKREFFEDNVKCSLKQKVESDNSFLLNYSNIFNNKYTLYKKNDLYYLKDEKGEIQIQHPDLLLVIL